MSPNTEKDTIPANHGQIFTVDIEDEYAFSDVQASIMQLTGIKEVLFDDGVFPHEVIIHTERPVSTADVQQAVRQHGFQATPVSAFPLTP